MSAVPSDITQTWPNGAAEWNSHFSLQQIDSSKKNRQSDSQSKSEYTIKSGDSTLQWGTGRGLLCLSSLAVMLFSIWLAVWLSGNA